MLVIIEGIRPGPKTCETKKINFITEGWSGRSKPWSGRSKGLMARFRAELFVFSFLVFPGHRLRPEIVKIPK